MISPVVCLTPLNAEPTNFDHIAITQRILTKRAHFAKKAISSTLVANRGEAGHPRPWS